MARLLILRTRTGTSSSFFFFPHSVSSGRRVGLIVEVPDLDTFQRMMESEAAADAMKFDGVRLNTILMLVEPEPST